MKSFHPARRLLTFRSIGFPPNICSRPRQFHSSKLMSAPSSNAPSTSTGKMGALITGGSRGIGIAIAKLLHSQGRYTVGVLSRSERPHSVPEDIIHIQADVSKPSDIWAEIERQAKGTSLLHPSVLVNAAGISQSSFLNRTGLEAIDSIIDVNLRGTIWMSKVIGKRMTAAARDLDALPEGWHSPCIINLSSLLGLKGGQAATVYAASKAGVLGFTRAMALEYGRMGVRVNAIVPGYVDTNMTTDFSPQLKGEILERIPLKLKRFGTPEEIAEAALFLAKNEYANNCVINLDGGLSAT